MLIRVGGRTDDAGSKVWMWCPGCEDLHRILLNDTTGWTWNGSSESPSFTPSILVRGGSKNIVCHSFVTDGKWNYLTDCTHSLAGQIIDMVPIPEGLIT